MKRLWILALALGLGLASQASATATAQVQNAPTPAMPGTPPPQQPTPKPLYVDYVPPDWAKAKEHIGLEQAKKWVNDKGVLFCDARAKVEYDQGHIPGAIPLPVGEFEKFYNMHLQRIQKARHLVTYCHGVGCRLSEKCANALVDKGYNNVAVFFGGWPQWQMHNLPIETGDPFASDAALVVPTAVPAPATLSGPLPVTPSAVTSPDVR